MAYGFESNSCAKYLNAKNTNELFKLPRCDVRDVARVCLRALSQLQLHIALKIIWTVCCLITRQVSKWWNRVEIKREQTQSILVC